MSLRLLSFLTLGFLTPLALAYPLPTPIKPGVPGVKKGDIIAPLLDEQIAAWCDFSKQIVVTHGNTLCAYVGDKVAPSQSKATAAATVTPKVSVAKKGPRLPRDLKPTLYEMSEYGDSDSVSG